MRGVSYKHCLLTFFIATNDGSGKYQNKEKPVKRQRKLGIGVLLNKLMAHSLLLSSHFRKYSLFQGCVENSADPSQMALSEVS